MATEKNDLPHNLNALAREACDLWQEHLATYAADAKGKAELMRLMEPSRRLFAEWAGMMQHAPYGEFMEKTAGRAGGKPAGADGGAKPGSDASAARTKPVRAASGGDPVDVAQLADRVAELEEKLARFESGTAQTAGTSPHNSRPRPKS